MHFRPLDGMAVLCLGAIVNSAISKKHTHSKCEDCGTKKATKKTSICPVRAETRRQSAALLILH